MPKKPGKDRGSITQKADAQQIRISQVSNVNKTVSEMGRKTSREIQETQRRVAAGGDTKEVSGAMTGVLESMKATVDSLQRGVEAATLGTAKATQDAIKQYGQAISEDFKVNRQNMVASALASSTPIFGYFASKFLETDVFKKTKDKLSESISGVFKRKSKGGSIPDEFADNNGKGVAQAAKEAKQESDIRKKEASAALKEKREKYDKPFEEKIVESLAAIQSVLGAQTTRFAQWYEKFLLEHPYYRASMTTYKAIGAAFRTGWKAVYFFFKPRGGYKRFLSKAKQPLEAINQNIGVTFLETIPRLDAIMIYTKATAIAIRDLSSHTTGVKYPPMDPSRLGATWSIAGTAIKGARALGKGLYKAGKWATGKVGKQDPMLGAMLDIPLELFRMEAIITDLLLTGPGRMAAWKKKRGVQAKEKERLFGGLSGTDKVEPAAKKRWLGLWDPAQQIGGTMSTLMGTGKGPGPGPAPAGGKYGKDWYAGLGKMGKQQERKRAGKFRMPKFFRNMGKRFKPNMYVQGVYDEYRMRQEKKKAKDKKKMMGYTVNLMKGVKEHNKREKKRGILRFLGGIFSGAKNILGGAIGWIAKLFLGGGLLKMFMKGGLLWKAARMIFGKGGPLMAMFARIFAKGGPLLSVLGSAWFWGPIGAGLLGYGIGTVINKYFTGPIIQGYLDRNREISRERGKKLDIGKDLFTRVRAGDVEAEHTRAARVGVRQAHVSKELPSMLADNLGSFEMGRLDYMKENIAEYQDWTVAEIKAYRREHFKKRGKNRVKKAGHGTVGRVGITLMKVAGPIGHIAQAHWDPGRAYKAGREIEEDYIEWLNEVKRKEIFGDADLRAAHEEKRNRLAEAKKRHAGKTTREVDIISRAEKHAERTAKEQANKEFNKRGGLTMVGAKKWANENGGEYWEYVGLKIDQAKKISIQYGATFEEKAKAYTTISMEKAEELGKKYKTDAKQFFGKTLSQAEALGKTLLEKSKNVGIEIRDKAIEVAEETGIKKKKGWWATEWEAMKKWGSTPEKGPGAKGAATGAMVGAGVQKTGEYIEIGKGNFVEIYRSTKSKISELWETTVTPERKEWLRQNAGKLIATGKMTVDQLKKLGVEVTDTMLEEGKKGVEATQSAAIYTTQTISNTVSNATQAGGGGGNDQTFMAEFSLNRVIEGDLP